MPPLGHAVGWSRTRNNSCGSFGFNTMGASSSPVPPHRGAQPSQAYGRPMQEGRPRANGSLPRTLLVHTRRRAMQKLWAVSVLASGERLRSPGERGRTCGETQGEFPESARVDAVSAWSSARDRPYLRPAIRLRDARISRSRWSIKGPASSSRRPPQFTRAGLALDDVARLARVLSGAVSVRISRQSGKTACAAGVATGCSSAQAPHWHPPAL